MSHSLTIKQVHETVNTVLAYERNSHVRVEYWDIEQSNWIKLCPPINWNCPSMIYRIIDPVENRDRPGLIGRVVRAIGTNDLYTVVGVTDTGVYVGAYGAMTKERFTETYEVVET